MSGHETLTANGHTHGDHDHDHSHGAEAEGIIAALKGQGDKGAIVTLLGLLTNIGLTVVKGAAGWYLNSAVLIADAGHSLSDLMGDLVTLFFYTLSRRPASTSYPYGYGKFESLGTSTVAVFLLLGAWAIGGHSYSQLGIDIPFLPSLHNPHSHSSHDDDGVPDPNAAWVALLSILVKEGMYRLSSSVAKTENSPVLLANALHHRSDMWSSFVSLVAILGNWFLPTLPLDAIGGLLVSLLILHQAYELLSGSLFELTDHGLPSETLNSISQLISTEISSSSLASSVLPKLSDVRGIRRGAHLYIEASADVVVQTQLTVADAVALEDAIVRRVRASKPNVKEIRLRFVPVEL